MLDSMEVVDGFPIKLTDGSPLFPSDRMDCDKLMRVLSCSTETGRGTNNRGRRRNVLLVLFWCWTNGTWGIHPLFSFCCTMVINGGIRGNWS